MAFGPGPVTVRAPASSANLGPGYDSFGLALSRYDEVAATVTGAGLEVRTTGCGAGEVPTDERHLVVRAMRAAFDRLAGQPPGLRISCRNAIPHGRGLGSSAAAIVSGIALARALTEDGEAMLDERAALELATELEGHPDNVAACQLGGATVAWLADDGAGRAVRLNPTGVLPALLIPSDRSATEAARALLPASVPHADAAFNAGRAGVAGAGAHRPAGPAVHRDRGPAAPAISGCRHAGDGPAGRGVAGRRPARDGLRRRAVGARVDERAARAGAG